MEIQLAKMFGQLDAVYQQIDFLVVRLVHGEGYVLECETVEAGEVAQQCQLGREEALQVQMADIPAVATANHVDRHFVLSEARGGRLTLDARIQLGTNFEHFNRFGQIDERGKVDNLAIVGHVQVLEHGERFDDQAQVLILQITVFEHQCGQLVAIAQGQSLPSVFGDVLEAKIVVIIAACSQKLKVRYLKTLTKRGVLTKIMARMQCQMDELGTSFNQPIQIVIIPIVQAIEGQILQIGKLGENVAKLFVRYERGAYLHVLTVR